MFDFYEDTLPGKANEARIKGLKEITDREFTVKLLPGNRWVLVSSKIHKDTDGLVQTYLFIRDASGLKKRERLFAYLNQAAAALAKTRDTSGALSLVAQLIVPEFADWFTIDRIKNNLLELLLLKHKDAAKIEWAYQYRERYPADLNSDSGPAVVVKTGKPGFVPVVTEEMLDLVITDPVQRGEVKKIGMQSVIIMPIFINDKVGGLVNFITSAAGHYFDEADLEFAENFAHLVGLALENARINEDNAAEITRRKQSEEQFRFLTDAIPHKLWTASPEGRATYYNEKWYEYTGVHGFEALKERIWDHIHPDDRTITAVEYPKAIQAGVPVEMEQRLKRHDEAYRWHFSRLTPYKDEEDKTILWVGTSTDIHEQKVAGMEMAALNEELAAANEELMSMNEEVAATNEELGAANEELISMNEEVAATNEELASANEELAAINEELTDTQASLLRSEKLFRSIALNIPGSLIIVIDKDHCYLTIEGDLMTRLGYNKNDYEGKHPADISAERYEASRSLYERVIAGETFSVERKADTGQSFIVHFVPLRDGKGEVEAGLIITLDITEIKQAEEKSAKLAAIVESSDDAIISKTLDSIVTSWNAAAGRLFGYTEDEMIGETIYKLIPPDRLDEEPQILARLRSGERVDHFETKRITKDGKMLDVSLTISPVKDTMGNIIGASKIARDITERKTDEARKNDFIGMVSHELKTPLTSLSAIMQVVHEKLKRSDDGFLAGATEKANTQIRRMTGMINGFLNISRLEGGKMLIEKQPFELNRLLHEILAEARLTATAHTVQLKDNVRVTVNADRDKTGSVISNLVSNAVKYSPKGKLVEISYQVRGNMVEVSIQDEGMGIKPQDIGQIFDRYYRVETNHTRHISGFGIGLYLSAEIIKQQGGEIWVESQSGKGSTFYFTLPLATDQ